MSQPRTSLLEGPVGPHLIRLATPMVIGIASILLFNVIDTLYVGQLGAAELAAMTYTFPVVFVITSVAMGLSVGGTAAIAQAIGHGDEDQVRRLATDVLILANIVVIILAVVGLLTIDPLFAALGASPEEIVLIRRYMVPSYLGVGFLVIPLVGNGAIRATGDTKTPSYIMMVAGFVNAVLDPILIFGVGPIPGLGLLGAALATVSSYVLAFVAAFWVLTKRERLLVLKNPGARVILASWKQVLKVGLPASGTNLLVPLSAAILTRLVSDHGQAAVAAYGVGTRLDSLALIGISALSTAMTPFVGQNFGAGRCDRIREALRFSLKNAIVYGLGVTAVLFVTAPWLASLFNDDPQVQAYAVTYLRIVPLSYGLYGMSILINSTFNASDHPLRATLVIVVRLFVLAIPLAALGGHLDGFRGIAFGVGAANFAIGGFAWLLVRRFLDVQEAAIAARGPDPTPAPAT